MRQKRVNILQPHLQVMQELIIVKRKHLVKIFFHEKDAERRLFLLCIIYS